MLSQIRVYVYKGRDRHNATQVVEKNNTVGVGAPIRISINDGAIIVVQSLGTEG